MTGSMLAQLLERYPHSTIGECDRALREIMQSTILLGLWRVHFFEHAVFHGGTALRLVHGLARFSEDLDFSLLAPDTCFDLDGYLQGAIRELSSKGIRASVREDRGKEAGSILRRFICAEAPETMRSAGVPSGMASSVPSNRLLKVRLEVEADPAPGSGFEPGYLLVPVPFQVRCSRMADLFAGKMHAVLFRRWRHRVKGRDWFDLVWFVSRDAPLNLTHLEAKMRKSGDLTMHEPLTESGFRSRLERVISGLDVESARHEVESFVEDHDSLDVWSREFFRSLAERIRIL